MKQGYFGCPCLLFVGIFLALGDQATNNHRHALDTLRRFPPCSLVLDADLASLGWNPTGFFAPLNHSQAQTKHHTISHIASPSVCRRHIQVQILVSALFYQCIAAWASKHAVDPCGPDCSDQHMAGSVIFPGGIVVCRGPSFINRRYDTGSPMASQC